MSCLSLALAEPIPSPKPEADPEAAQPKAATEAAGADAAGQQQREGRQEDNLILASLVLWSIEVRGDVKKVVVFGGTYHNKKKLIPTFVFASIRSGMPQNM